MNTKAAVVYEYRKPMVIEELELDGPKQKEVLIKYGASGLCHSDLSVMKKHLVCKSPWPLIERRPTYCANIGLTPSCPWPEDS